MPPNWFSLAKPDFTGVVCDDGHIDCEPFLAAAAVFVTILDSQTHLVFLPVKKRFGNNVRQMRDVYDELRKATGEKERITLNDLIEYERLMGESDISADCASRGVVWFCRSCQFLLAAFDRTLGKTETLAGSFRAAYALSLVHHHDPIVKPLFDAAMRFCPERDVFFRQLSGTDSLKTTEAAARKYFKAMAAVKDRLVQFCVFNEWDVRYGNTSWDEMKKCHLKKRPRTEA